VEAAPRAGTANVEGQAFAPEGERRPLVRERLLLLAYPNKERFFDQRTDEHGRYRFSNVPPGTYMLTNRLVGAPGWRLRVDVKPGQDVFLDLGPGNSAKVRDDFPGKAG
jgi:hypothetical protein